MIDDATYTRCNTERLAVLEQRDVLYKACELAFMRSCERSESRMKWTQKDQKAHEALKDALDKATENCVVQR